MEGILESMLNQICGADLFESIYETLAINLFSSGGAYSSVYSAVRSLYNSIMPIGVMMMFIYFMIALVDKLSSETFTWEQFFRQLAMVLAAKFLMEHGFEILETLFGIGLAVTAKVSEISGTDMSEVTIDANGLIQDFLASSNFTGIFKIFGQLLLMLYLIIPWALSFLMRLAISIICYSRVVEIYARASLAPIALSDFFHSGLHGSGWRFLKNFLASCLQGALILVIAIVFSRLYAAVVISDSTNMITLAGKYLAFYASAVMLMFKSLPLAKELVGSA